VNAIDVDARGLRCPMPVIRLAEAARHAPVGTRITALATDPAARHDIAAWCRMRDHELLEMTEMSANADSGRSGASASDARDSAEGVTENTAGAHPAYLRFVVLVRTQPPNAAGAGSESARPSRLM